MLDQRIALEVAAFLDSAPAAALGAIPVALRRRVAEHLLESCYHDLGREPRLLDGEALEELLGSCLPGYFAPRAAEVEQVPAIVYAFLAHLEQSAVVTQSFELRRALDPALERFLEEVRSGRATPRSPRRAARPFVHGAAKTGRNDPCPCGSGRKFKACHGKTV
jgi:hypothetical protein